MPAYTSPQAIYRREKCARHILGKNGVELENQLLAQGRHGPKPCAINRPQLPRQTNAQFFNKLRWIIRGKDVLWREEF
jgi:hypothetical protein